MPCSASSGISSPANSRSIRAWMSRQTTRIAASCWRGRLPGEAGWLEPGCQLLTQSGDANLKELVEVGGDDADEADPLEERQVRVLGEGEHPLLEVEER